MMRRRRSMVDGALAGSIRIADRLANSGTASRSPSWPRHWPPGKRTPRTRPSSRSWRSRMTMSFANETPLDDVLKYIKTASAKPGSPIPIYVDPMGSSKPSGPSNSTVSDRPGRCPAQDVSTTGVQATGTGLLRPRRRADHQLGSGYPRGTGGGRPRAAGHRKREGRHAACWHRWASARRIDGRHGRR